MFTFDVDVTRLEYKAKKVSEAFKKVTGAQFIERIVREDIQDHFDKAQGDLGPWAVSYAAIRRNDPKRPTLTRTRALRFGLQYALEMYKGLTVKPSQVTKDYAWTHQLGMTINLFGKYPHTFPQRKFAYVSKKAQKLIKQKTIESIINA